MTLMVENKGVDKDIAQDGEFYGKSLFPNVIPLKQVGILKSEDSYHFVQA